MNIHELLAACMERGASDLHLCAGRPPTLRVDGELQPLALPALATEEVRTAVAAVAPHPPGDAIAEADFCFDAPGVGRFRVNAYSQHRGAAAAFRAVASDPPTLAQLGMGPEFAEIADAPDGLVLVTGATGSGKSTTLAALLRHINDSRRQHILTIEDPIEFVHESSRCLVNQREVGRDTRDFASALRAALREDPDVILVGEMRDQETIRLALSAAETGHLVLASLHAPSAAKTVDRIVEAFPGGEQAAIRALLSESLRAVIAQTLIPRAGGGRVAAREVLIATPAVRNLIREHKVAQLHSTMQTSAAAGMRTLDQCLRHLVEQGEVSAESALRAARFPDSFGR